MSELPRGPSAMSTMWGIGRFDRAADFVRSVAALGLRHVELNHQVTPDWAADLADLQARGVIGVTSVHDPCPRDPDDGGLGAAPQISSLDESERRRAVAVATRTIRLARSLGAEAVIIHPGRVEVDASLERRLRRLYPRRQDEPAAYQEALADLGGERARRAEPHLDASSRSLRELKAVASDLGLRLGIENRYHFYEIPTLDELGRLLDELGADVVGYWHDTGHAQGLANLGFGDPLEWLRRFGVRTIGVHLHDVAGQRDHLAPAGRDVPFAAVRDHLPATAIRVCEFASSNEPPDVAKSIAYLRGLNLV